MGPYEVSLRERETLKHKELSLYTDFIISVRFLFHA